MRIARLEKNGSTHFYALESDTLARRFDGDPTQGAQLSNDAAVPWSAAELRAPVVPSKILCIGRNYAAHAKELGNEVPAEPLVFLKPPSSLIGPNASVVLPRQSSRVDHEAELGVVIGKRVKNVSRANALDAVFGYTAVCDVTARDLQKKDGQWARAKGFDTFCPTGPWIETELDARDIRVQCRINADMRQDGRTSQMFFDIPTLIEYLSQAFTLEPGDLVVTGTPEGVGPLVTGDELSVIIEGIGTLTVGVAAAS